MTGVGRDDSDDWDGWMKEKGHNGLRKGLEAGGAPVMAKANRDDWMNWMVG